MNRRGSQRSLLAAALAAMVCLFTVLAPRIAEAHAFAPIVLDVRADGERLDVQYKLSLSLRTETGGPDTVADPTFPEGCQPLGERRVERDQLAEIRRWSLHCPEDVLSGLAIELPDPTITEKFLVRFSAAPDAEPEAMVLAPGATWELGGTGTGESAGGSVFTGYTILGIEHILLGPDHLLFVLCLLLLVRNFRTLLGTITAFTIAHSITLGLAVLGVVSVPGPPVEAVIALSIVLLASEAARLLLFRHDSSDHSVGSSDLGEDDNRQSEPEPTSIAARRPWAVAFGFGLLHGLGFAGALAEVGVPEGQVPTALLGFNIGVELGQILFVLAALALHWLAGKLTSVRWRQRLELVVTYGAGGLAAFWVIERTVAFWG